MSGTLTLHDLNALYAYRYLSAVALVTVFWDHLLTLDVEVSGIWNNPTEHIVLKIVFVLFRYGSDIALAYSAYLTTGAGVGLTQHECSNWPWLFSIPCIVFVSSSQFVVTLRINSLWDGRKSVAYGLASGAAVAIVILSTMVVLMCRQLVEKVAFIGEPLNMCLFTGKGSFTPWVMGLMAFYDFLILLLMVLDVLDRPRQHNSQVITHLRLVGARSIAGLFVFRLASTLLVALGDTGESLQLVPLSWALGVAITSRLYLRVGHVTSASTWRNPLDLIPLQREPSYHYN